MKYLITDQRKRLMFAAFIAVVFLFAAQTAAAAQRKFKDDGSYEHRFGNFGQIGILRRAAAA